MELNQEELTTLFKGLHRRGGYWKAGLHGGIACLCSIIFVFTFWVPDVNDAVALDGQIHDSLQNLSIKVRELRQKPAMDQELANLEAELPRLKNTLPNDKEMPALLDNLNASILSHSLTLGEFRPLVPVDRDVMTVIPVKVQIQGDSENVSRIPNFLADFPRKVSLTNFQMSYQAEQKSWILSGHIYAFAQLGVRLNTKATDAGKETGKTSGGGR